MKIKNPFVRCVPVGLTQEETELIKAALVRYRDTYDNAVTMSRGFSDTAKAHYLSQFEGAKALLKKLS